MAQQQDALAFPFPVNGGHFDFPEKWAEVRSTCPVARVRLPHGQEAWLATRFEEVRTVLVDQRFSRALAAEQESRMLATSAILNSSLIGLDPPDHTRLRALTNRAFTARRVERMRPQIITLVEKLIAETAKQPHPVDLLEHFVRPLPALVISAMMGVPESDVDQFVTWSGQAVAGPNDQELSTAGYQGLMGYFRELVAAKREAPGDDLLSALIAARDEQDRLSDDELVALSVLLLAAGHETNTVLFSAFVVLLTTTYRDQWDHLGEHPEDIPATLEELLRMVPRSHIGGGFPRVAKEDLELAGVKIKAGEAVIPAMDAANRDPEFFTDPERMDFTRVENPHFAFGGGIHFCLGASLARMQMQEALRVLRLHCPDLRPAVPVEELELTPQAAMRLLKQLPVTW